MAKEIKLKVPKAIDCSNCKFLCSLNFSEDLRSEICRSFWKLGDYRRQKDFILMNVKSSSPKRRRPSREPSENSKIRTNSKSFFLLSKRVCQSFFLKTLSISNGPLIKAFKHKNVYTNFFDGDDKRGKHTPSNKLSNDIVDSVVSHVEQFTIKNQKCKKRVITDPSIRSLRHLYSIYKENHEDCSPSYTSFKRIFNEHNFAFPPDRTRCRPLPKLVQPKTDTTDQIIEFREQDEFDDDDDEDFIEEHTIEGEEIPSAPDEEVPEVSQPKVIVTQVPDSSKFFSNQSQVFEIQFIEIPSIIKHI